MRVLLPAGSGTLDITTNQAVREPLPLDTADPLLAPATHTVFEWTDYWVRCDAATALLAGGRPAERIADGLFRLRVENQLGLTTLQPLDERGLPLASLRLEVLSPKFPSVAQHLAFLRSLLDDLFARAARLPFAVSAQTARGVVEAPSPPTPLFTLHFLLQHAAGLREAVGVVLARPHRRLTDHPEIVPLHAASEADADVLLSVLTSPERWAPARGFPLAERLGGFAPTEVWQRRPEESLDTPENRFVLAFLRALLAAADDLLAQPWWRQVAPERQRAIREARSLLRVATEHPTFAAVGELRRIPTSSRVLLRREGYRQLLQLWRLFHLARRPFFGALQQAIDLRTVDVLYEVWCFFALVDKIKAAFGIKPVLELRVSDEHGLQWESRARFGAAGTLVYNRTHREWSVSLRPDFLWLRAGKPEVALDAKFRLDRPDWEAEDDGTPVARVKLDDLYKMHTYRDALGLRAAVVVYPGDVEKFLRFNQRQALPTLHELLVDDVNGIGAIPLRPQGERQIP